VFKTDEKLPRRYAGGRLRSRVFHHKGTKTQSFVSSCLCGEKPYSQRGATSAMEVTLIRSNSGCRI